MFSLPVAVLLILTVITGSVRNILVGGYSKRFTQSAFFLWSFNFVGNLSTLVGLVCIYAVSGGFKTFSFGTLGLGVLMGVTTVFGNYAYLKAVANGPLSYTTVMIALSAIIPTFSGLFYGEKISPVQGIGIVLMALCMILSPAKQENDGEAAKKATVKWLLFTGLAFCFSGGCGVIQKVHQSDSALKDEMPLLLITAFAFSVAYSGIMLLKAVRSEDVQPAKVYRSTPWALFLPVLTGLAFSIPHSVNLFLAGFLPAVVFFPVVNLLPMILTILFSLILFREKISVKRWVGIIIGIASTVLVSGLL